MKNEKNKLINGFVYSSVDGYIGIDNGDLKSPLLINKKVVAKILGTMKKNKIQNIYFGDPFMEIKNISFLKDFSFLKGLRIALENYNIEPIKSCPELEELVLSFHYEGNINFSSFKSLKSLSIPWSNESSKSIFKCDKLEFLNVSKYNGLSLQDFSVYENTLKELYLTDASIQTLSGIENLKQLKILHIVGARKLTDIEDIQECENLEKIFIHGCKNIQYFHYIMYLKKLKKLNLDSLGEIPSIGFLKPIKSLEEFYMVDSTSIVDGNLNVLEELKNNHRLKKVIFKNRNHYTHKAEDLGYKVPPQLLNIFGKIKE